MDVPEELDDVALERLRALIGEREDVVLSIVAPDLTLRWASRAGSRGLYRRDPAVAYGAPVRDLVHDLDATELAQALERAFAGATVSCHVRAHDAEGAWHAVRIVAWPIAGGEAVLAITVPEDGLVRPR